MRNFPFTHYIAILAAYLVVLLITGCASAPIRYQPDPAQPPVLEIDPGVTGRGCLYARYSEGELEVIVAQDGTSDWSISRLFAWIGEVAGAVFGGAASGSGMQGPDPLQGCAQLFGDGGDDGPGT